MREKPMVEVNFAYLKNSKLLKKEFSTADKIRKLYEIDDYRDVMINARRLLESITRKIIDWENLNPYYPIPSGQQRNLRSNIQYLRENLTYPLSIYNLFDEVRRIGNEAVHASNFKTSKDQAWHVICDINDILVFLLNSYEEERLSYMRPDIMLEAIDHPEKFKPRKVINNFTQQPVKNENVVQAQEFLKTKKKKRRRFGRLRHFLKH